MINEMLDTRADTEHKIQQIFAQTDWLEQHGSTLTSSQIEVHEASAGELKKVSNLVTPPPVLALVAIPEVDTQKSGLLSNPVLVFEAIRDPGNLGTIMRTADWFGIGHMVCSPDSVDLYNPKVVQSTMGAISRVSVHYLDLEEWMNEPEMKQRIIYGTFLDGDNIYQTTMEKDPVILFGNESSGLSNRYDPYLTRKISIPSFSQTGKSSESLNVASSVAVVCSELRREE